MEDFSSITATTYTQFRLILGDFVFANIEKAHPFFGPLYFVCYVFFVFFILMVSFRNFDCSNVTSFHLHTEYVYGHFERHLL